MITIKSYTDIEQSKKLAEILPIESADMYYPWDIDSKSFLNIPIVKDDSYYVQGSVDCWSLAALLNVIPKDESIDYAISFGYYNGKGEYVEKWLCAFEKEGEKTDDFIIETIYGDNPIDTCVAMIERLHKLNLL